MDHGDEPVYGVLLLSGGRKAIYTSDTSNHLPDEVLALLRDADSQILRRLPIHPVSPTRFLPPIYFLYDRLLGRDEKGLPVPELAVSWKANATAQRWIFKLREGVKFHDDKPFTSADGVYTF